MNGRPRGIMLCIVGTVCNAAMMSTSGRILSEKLDVLRLAFYTAPVSCIALFPFCYFHEVSFDVPHCHTVSEMCIIKHVYDATWSVSGASNKAHERAHSSCACLMMTFEHMQSLRLPVKLFILYAWPFTAVFAHTVLRIM